MMRIGPRSWIAGLLAWILLPRFERFRVCARCQCVRKEDVERGGAPSGTTVCCGEVDLGRGPFCIHLAMRLD